ncbi:synaptic vesicle 2-related protein-like [Myxocyprinus asiaticus]|uniref:synaptic vesicle 2-related protein-like n=1 Tax=Myxocyprinus asiaticus TaxID=70543 RepID=UPI002221A07E|nr:synaptic vesicle 2-related protein-like [Myxocyprinus asiaticus]XP_051551777.1 synaptic vesicle 2-related protein-like [Myxocyprinus asiaticus]
MTLYTEFLPVKSRGTAIILLGAFWTLGAVFEVLLATLIMPTLGWKWLLALSTMPLLAFAASCCVCMWLPESARFDVLRGREDKALNTLKNIAAANGSSVPKGRLVAKRQVSPTATRAIGIGTSSEMARVRALITPFVAQVLLKSSVYLTLSVYFICCLLGAAASWVLPMETMGRSLH